MKTQIEDLAQKETLSSCKKSCASKTACAKTKTTIGIVFGVALFAVVVLITQFIIGYHNSVPPCIYYQYYDFSIYKEIGAYVDDIYPLFISDPKYYYYESPDKTILKTDTGAEEPLFCSVTDEYITYIMGRWKSHYPYSKPCSAHRMDTLYRYDIKTGQTEVLLTEADDSFIIYGDSNIYAVFDFAELSINVYSYDNNTVCSINTGNIENGIFVTHMNGALYYSVDDDKEFTYICDVD